jgi:hypothetical protein
VGAEAEAGGGIGAGDGVVGAGDGAGGAVVGGGGGGAVVGVVGDGTDGAGGGGVGSTAASLCGWPAAGPPESSAARRAGTTLRCGRVSMSGAPASIGIFAV